MKPEERRRDERSDTKDALGKIMLATNLDDFQDGQTGMLATLRMC